MDIREKFKERVFIARLHAQDKDAFREVYEYYLNRIYRYVYFKVSIVETAQDLSSEVFLRAWQYIYTQKGRIENLNAFLYQIARNAVIDFYRKRSRTDLELREDIYVFDDHKQTDMFASIHAKKDFQEIEKILRTLREEYHDVVILKYIEQLDDSEIGRIMNRSKGAVRVLLHRAMNTLREKLQEKKP